MDIKDKTVLIIGGWGLVGSSVCRKLMTHNPKRLVVTSLRRAEAEEAVADLRKEFPRTPRKFFVPWWGNIFVRHDLKDLAREEMLGDEKYRGMFIEDIVDELTDDVLKRSTVYKLFHEYKPDIVIDCVNSATAIAYQDIFQSSRELLREVNRAKKGAAQQSLVDAAERLLCTLYVPQIVRHVQLMYRSMSSAGTGIYVKIGTSGTGGMGLNIPYTHSEERPSRVLLSKSSIAGAHTLLLYLMARTPDAPITKEIKPTAAIAWKKIGYGEVRRRGKSIKLFDCPPEHGIKLEGKLRLRVENAGLPLNDTLKSVFIDTGENGLFSRAEFEAIATPGQMEYVTPEEIAESVIYEIKGGNTGHDIINALDNAALGPTYRAGFLFAGARKKLAELERQRGVASIAFESLGPPRLSKLLYEAHLLKLGLKKMTAVAKSDPKTLSQTLADIVASDSELRSRIISIGIPILMPDGKTLLRGNEILVPPNRGENELKITPKGIDLWAHDGWIDLRVANMQRWKARMKTIFDWIDRIPEDETSSRHMLNREYWDNFEDIDEGKLVGWIFNYEEHGMRMKA
jgi:hypothetical protein